MVTRISTRGQLVLPGKVRRQLGIQAGDAIVVQLEGERIVLTLQRKGAKQAKVVTDTATGFPVLTLGRGAPVLTNREIDEMLADFP